MQEETKKALALNVERKAKELEKAIKEAEEAGLIVSVFYGNQLSNNSLQSDYIHVDLREVTVYSSQH